MNQDIKNHYIYILACGGDGYYIGETGDFNVRFQEHCKGNGSRYVKKFNFDEIYPVAVYEYNLLLSYLYYDHKVRTSIFYMPKWKNVFTEGPPRLYGTLGMEDFIAEWMHFHNADSDINIVGGKFKNENYKLDGYQCMDSIKSLPACKCNIPCNVRYIHKRIYFVCGSIELEHDDVNICDYVSEYTGDREQIAKFNKLMPLYNINYWWTKLFNEYNNNDKCKCCKRIDYIPVWCHQFCHYIPICHDCARERGIIIRYLFTDYSM